MRFRIHCGSSQGVLLVGIILVGGLGEILFAQAASSNQDGFYTVEQAQKGQVIYKTQCATCHGDALQGSGKNVPLAGDKFLVSEQIQPLVDLFYEVNGQWPQIQAQDP